MSDPQHPWITQPSAEKVHVPPVLTSKAIPRPTTPQPGVPRPDSSHRLPRRDTTQQAEIWWLGVHGGAGESALCHLLPGSRSADHAWPIVHDGSKANVVLVARSNAHGLMAAQQAATDWASSSLPTINLLGLVIVADAPGKLPKLLRDLAQVVSGGVPTVWHLPWVESWRLGELVSPETSPQNVRAIISAIGDLTSDRTA